MVLTSESPGAPESVAARRVRSFEESLASGKTADEAYEAIARESFERERAGHAPRTNLALLEGEPAGVGRAVFAGDCPAVLMIGGAMLAQAGAVSRPVLERLGFQVVAEREVLLDPAQ